MAIEKKSQTNVIFGTNLGGFLLPAKYMHAINTTLITNIAFEPAESPLLLAEAVLLNLLCLEKL
jgi:hypothetical protein